MGTCYYLARGDGKLFDLDKAYGLADYLRNGRCMDIDEYNLSNGYECDIGTDVEVLILVLAEHQPSPCGTDGIERRRWAERMIKFAGGQPVRLYSENDVPLVAGGYLDRVIAERWPDVEDYPW